MDGRGSSSSIDDVILRERNYTILSSAAASTTLGDRLNYLQNWRHDVVAITKPNAEIVERQRYTSYGVPRVGSVGDFNNDGAVDDGDFTIFNGSYDAFTVEYSAGGTKNTTAEAWAVCDDDIWNDKSRTPEEHRICHYAEFLKPLIMAGTCAAADLQCGQTMQPHHSCDEQR